MQSRELIKLIKKQGWELIRVKGDHHIFKHKEKDLLITIPHPVKDLSIGVVKETKNKAGIQ